MDYKLIEKITGIITDRILTPVIYMLEDEAQIELVCFCDANMEAEVFAETEKQLEELLPKQVVLLDIREYNEYDRMQIISEGEIIYTANPIFEKLFAVSMAEDAQRSMIEKNELLKRYSNSGNIYLQ